MTTQQQLDDRYGRRRGSRSRWGIGVAIAVGALATGLLAWSTVAASIDSVDADGTGFVLVDEHSVILRFQVTAPPGRDIACALEAQDEEHGVVGWRIVEYPAAEHHAQAFEEAIPTIAAATTGFVNSCWVT